MASSSLKIKDVELLVRLGCSAEERAVSQKVLLNIFLKFSEELKASESDELVDTFCYDEIVKEVLLKIEGREFKLIEFLAKEIYKIVASQLDQRALLQVSVLKCSLPVEWINKGAEFTYGDF